MSVLGTWNTAYPRGDVNKLVATATPVNGVVAGDMTLGAGWTQSYNTSANINCDGLASNSAVAGDTTTASAYTGARVWKFTLTIPAGNTVSALRLKYASGIQTGNATVTAVYVNGSNVSGDVNLQGASTYNAATVDIDLTSAGPFTSDVNFVLVDAPRAINFQLATLGNRTGTPGDLELSGTVVSGPVETNFISPHPRMLLIGAPRKSGPPLLVQQTAQDIFAPAGEKPDTRIVIQHPQMTLVGAGRFGGPPLLNRQNDGTQFPPAGEKPDTQNVVPHPLVRWKIGARGKFGPPIKVTQTIVQVTGPVSVFIPDTTALIITTYAPLVINPKSSVPPTVSLVTSGKVPVIGLTVIPPPTALVTTKFVPVISAPRNVVPPTTSLVTSGKVPVIGKGFIIPTKALTLTTFIPTVGKGYVVPTKALTTTKFAPIIGKGYTVPTRSLTLTKFAPIVITPQTTIIPKVSLILTSFAPSAGNPKQVIPPTLSMITARFSPSIINPAGAVVPTRTLALTEFPPTVAVPRLVTPPKLSLTTGGLAPTVTTPRTVVPGTRSVATTTYPPSALSPRTVTPGTLDLALTRFSPVVQGITGITITPDTVTLGLTSYVPAVVTSHVRLAPRVFDYLEFGDSIDSELNFGYDKVDYLDMADVTDAIAF